MTYVTIPGSVTSIGGEAFSDCSSLTDISIPFGVTEIQSYTFDSCSSLTSITIPDTVTKIQSNAFIKCYNLTSITIPKSVTSIGSDALYSCENAVIYCVENSYAHTYAIVNNIPYELIPDENPDTIATGTCGNSLTWKLTGPEDEMVLTISGTGDMKSYNNPDESGEGYNVSPWNKYRSKIKSIVVEEGVTSIGNHAFYNSSINAVSLPSSLTGIGSKSFYYCNNLKSITIPANVKSIGNNAFAYCSGLTNITLPESLTSLGSGAFCECTALTSISIPDGVTEIGAFEGCRNLAEVTLPDGLKTISNNAFNGCQSLSSITLPDSVERIGSYAFEGCTALTSITIPGNPHGTVIETSAFAGCSSLTSIVLKYGVYEIGYRAFNNCSNLTSITIPESVTFIGELLLDGSNKAVIYCVKDSYAHQYAVNNKYSYQLIQAEPHPFVMDGEGVNWQLSGSGNNLKLTISGTGTMTNYSYYTQPWADKQASIKSIVIEDGVKSIGNYAFWGCSNLTSVSIPDGVTVIGNNAFGSCSSLTSISIPDSVTVIGNNAFDNCIGLTSVVIPGGKIGESAFYSCEKLENVTLSDGVTEIGNWAFCHCYRLKSLSLPCSVKKIGSGVFTEGGTKSITIPESVTYIGDNNYFSDINYGVIRCAEDSYAHQYALDNDIAFELVEPTWHRETVLPAVAATCTETGLTEGASCSVCGKVFIEQEETPALGHTAEVIPASEATCTEPGYSEGSKCSVCGEILTAQTETAPALGHDYGEWTVTKETSCAEPGEETRICNRDSSHVEKRTIEALAHHEEVIPGTAATCTETGLTEGKKCSVCGKTLVAQEEIPALGHDFKEIEDTGSAPTCDSSGREADAICLRCNYYKEGQDIPALGHDWGKWTVTRTVTCVEYGRERRVCSRNDSHFEERSIEPLGHKIKEISGKEPTCTEKGYTEKVMCSVCGEVFCEHAELAALGHSWDSGTVTTKPTCTKAGVKTFTCKRCKATKTQSVAATGHSWDSGTVTTKPTCTKEGVKTFTCKTCKATKKQSVAATGHSWNKDYTVDTKATCTAKGSKSKHCSKCGAKSSVIAIAATGHSWDSGTVTTKPTCTKAGVKTFTCKTCKTKKTNSVKATGHSWNSSYTVDTKATCTKTGSKSIHCSKCNVKKDGSAKTIAKIAHKFSAWKTTKAATEIAAGQQSHKCSACGKTETKTIAQLAPTLPAVSISKPKAQKKAMTVKWKKVSRANQKKIGSIQIQYSTDKTFKTGVKTVAAGKKGKSKKIKGLTSKTTYYVRIRSYLSSGGKVHVSKWSTIKAVKVK